MFIFKLERLCIMYIYCENFYAPSCEGTSRTKFGLLLFCFFVYYNYICFIYVPSNGIIQNTN